MIAYHITGQQMEFDDVGQTNKQLDRIYYNLFQPETRHFFKARATTGEKD